MFDVASMVENNNFPDCTFVVETYEQIRLSSTKFILITVCYKMYNSKYRY